MSLILLALLYACRTAPDSKAPPDSGGSTSESGASTLPSGWPGETPERPHDTAPEDTSGRGSPDSQPEETACPESGGPNPGGASVDTSTVDTASVDTSAVDTASVDSGEDGGAGADVTDVIVVGSGPAGLAAAISAERAGARVVVFERSDRAAEGVVYPGLLFGAQTRWQLSAGVTDTTGDAIAEWEELTGVDGSEPSVTTFIEQTSATLDWLDGLGVAIENVKTDPDCGSVARLHNIDTTAARTALLAAFTGDLRTSVEVLEPVIEAGTVVGVTWHDLETGTLGVTRAGAVVIATGGFLRDRDRVNTLRPELTDLDLLYETNPQSDGGGLGFLDAVGAASQNTDAFGLYVHAIQDPDEAIGEALILRSLDDAILVDAAGQRFIDEANARSLDLFDALPSGEIFAVFTDTWGGTMTAGRPAYNWADLSVEETVALSDLATTSDDVFLSDGVSAVATAAGIDADGLTATIDAVNASIAAEEADAFGREWTSEDDWEDELWWAVRLTPGLAKAFGGVATDLEGRVLDEAGESIPGLYAAGEVAGMIPGGGAGDGFSGTVTACYYGGRLAGANAARDAVP